MADTEDRDWQRLDKWLWFARFARTRSLAARLVTDGYASGDSVDSELDEAEMEDDDDEGVVCSCRANLVAGWPAADP